MRRVFLHYPFCHSQCYVYTARAQTKTYSNNLYVVSQPDLHVIRSVTANKIAHRKIDTGLPLSLVPRARETGQLKKHVHL